MLNTIISPCRASPQPLIPTFPKSPSKNSYSTRILNHFHSPYGVSSSSTLPLEQKSGTKLKYRLAPLPQPWHNLYSVPNLVPLSPPRGATGTICCTKNATSASCGIVQPFIYRRREGLKWSQVKYWFLSTIIGRIWLHIFWAICILW